MHSALLQLHELPEFALSARIGRARIRRSCRQYVFVPEAGRRRRARYRHVVQVLQGRNALRLQERQACVLPDIQHFGRQAEVHYKEHRQARA